MNYTITAAKLRRMGACSEQVEEVIRVFGRGPIEATKENIRKAQKEGISVQWLVNRVCDFDEVDKLQAKVRAKCCDQYGRTRECICHRWQTPARISTLLNKHRLPRK